MIFAIYLVIAVLFLVYFLWKSYKGDAPYGPQGALDHIGTLLICLVAAFLWPIMGICMAIYAIKEH